MTREGQDAGLIDLSRHISCWKGSLIPAAFAALVEGIRSEQARLDGKRFLVTLFRQEYDLDGLTEYVDFIEGFDDLPQARSFADAQADSLSREGGGTAPGRPLVRE